LDCLVSKKEKLTYVLEKFCLVPKLQRFYDAYVIPRNQKKATKPKS
jgi:hypothetical protein